MIYLSVNCWRIVFSRSKLLDIPECRHPPLPVPSSAETAHIFGIGRSKAVHASGEPQVPGHRGNRWILEIFVQGTTDFMTKINQTIWVWSSLNSSNNVFHHPHLNGSYHTNFKLISTTVDGSHPLLFICWHVGSLAIVYGQLCVSIQHL